jgi:hypothetical protein
MNKVDKASEISEHITFKRRLVDAIYAIYNPFTNLNCHYTVKDKKIKFNCANLIKECITCNNGIIAFNPNNVSTLVNKEKIKSNIRCCGCIQCHFHEENVLFKQ